ncbi:MAG: inorganic phosphate transporter [Negativicutes bacterium]|jgi:PiT family inorganic phosphate transporter
MEYEILFALTLLVAIAFLLTNSSNDSSSVIAAIIASNTAAPIRAVTLAAGCEFLGSITGASGVAFSMVGLLNVGIKGDVLLIVCAAFIAALGWNFFSGKIGLPSSSTHALVGGLVGCAICSDGFAAVNWGIIDLLEHGKIDGIFKIVCGLIFSPIIGIIVAFVMQKFASLVFRSAGCGLNKNLSSCQWLFTGLLAYNHGANDSQKVAGLIMLVFVVHGQHHGSQIFLAEQVPLWLRLICGCCMGLGVLVGSWAIIKTLGNKVCKMNNLNSFNSDLASFGVLASANYFGMPISATQVIAGSVVGVGAAESPRGVNWQIGGEMLLSWCVTMPATAVFGAILFKLFNLL